MELKTNYKFICLSVLCLALIVSGCAHDLEEEEVTSNPKQPPVEDNKLAAHVPNQVLIKLDKTSDKTEIINQINGEVITKLDRLNLLQVKIPAGKSVKETINYLNQQSVIKHAQPNYKYKATATPNDKYYTKQEQWGLKKIKAEQAWEVTNEDSDTVIAVLDTGVDVDHPDLGDKIIKEGAYNCFDDSSKVSDKFGHGTHVAGIAAAKTNNERGMAGVAWKAKILPVKVLNNYGTGSDLTTAKGIVYAANWDENHPDKRVVINMSFSGAGYSTVLKNAIDYAIKRGVVVVSSMGNKFASQYAYPAACEGVIAVGATNYQDEKASFSTTGEWISVSAPGTNIVSTMPEGNYTQKKGTSMASPHVAGAAALVLSAYPELSPSQVKAQLEQTAKDLGKAGFDSQFGHGQIDLTRAVTKAPDSNYGAIKVKVINTNSNSDFKAGIDLLLYDEEGKHLSTTKTDSEGKANFYDIPEGDYYLVASVKNKTIKSDVFTVNKKETREINLSLELSTGDQGFIALKWAEDVNMDLVIKEPNGVEYSVQNSIDTPNGNFSGDVRAGKNSPEKYWLDPFHEAGIYKIKVLASQPGTITLTKKLGEEEEVIKEIEISAGVYELDKGLKIESNPAEISAINFKE